MKAKLKKKEIRKFKTLAFISILMSLAPFIVDGLMQWMGVQAKATTTEWKIIWIGICGIFNAALFLSSSFRYALGVKRWLWSLFVVPIIFVVSSITTMMGQGSFIAQEAAIAKETQKIKAARLELVDTINANARQQTRINHVTNAGTTALFAANQLDKAEADVGNQKVTNQQSALIPLALINWISPKEINVETFLIAYFTLISFALLLVGYFFGELSMACLKRAHELEHGKTKINTTETTQTNSNKNGTAPNTPEQIQTAIDKKMSENPETNETKINRAWIDQAVRDMYGKSKAGQTLDKHIPYAKSLIKT